MNNTPERIDAENRANFELCEVGENHGSHSSLLVLPNEQMPQDAASVLLQQVSEEFNSYVLMSPLPSVDGVSAYTRLFHAELARRRMKRLTVFGIGAGATLAQALAVEAPKLVRRSVLLDATTRIAPGFVSRAIDRMERFLPLGLPLRPLSREFDSRPMLHRVRCPSLVLISHDAVGYVREQGEFIASKIPNAWLARLKNSYIDTHGALSEELQGLLGEFLEVPPKRPQKSL